MAAITKKRPRGIAAKILWYAVRFYQIAISPIIHIFPNSGCRFYPTCSEYAKQALCMHGAFKGSILAACRILRCQPFCNGGLDYVPKKFSWKRLFSQNKVDEP
ncbi:alpha-hemolysin family protein [Coraliomargarita sp. CAG:312]|nr:alpha-hemolysin family protein [Coraliomargarita sp. CAG:312]